MDQTTEGQETIDNQVESPIIDSTQTEESQHKEFQVEQQCEGQQAQNNESLKNEQGIIIGEAQNQIDNNNQNDVQQENNGVEQNLEEEQQQGQEQNSTFVSVQNYITQLSTQLGNDPFIQPTSLNAIAEFLLLNTASPLDSIVADPAQTRIQIEQLFQTKRKTLEDTVFQIMKVYDSFNIQSNMNMLEMIMRILKSKEKYIYVRKIQKAGEKPKMWKQSITDENDQKMTILHIHNEAEEHDCSCANHDQNQHKEHNHEQMQGEQPQDQIHENILLNPDGVASQVKQMKELFVRTEKNQEQGQQIQSQQSQQNQLEKITPDQQNVEGETDKQSEHFETNQQALQAQQVQEEMISNQIESLQQVASLKTAENEQPPQPILFHAEQQTLIQIPPDQVIEEQMPTNEALEADRMLEESENQEKLKTEQEKETITCGDIFGILSLKTLNLNQLLDLDKENNSLVFVLHNQYTVEIKGSNVEKKRLLNSDSPLSVLPQHLMINKIFPYFSALELFKMRIVCGQWKESIRMAWHQLFKREMFEQLLIKDLTKEIIEYSKLMMFRTPFIFKFRMIIKAMIQLIEWPAYVQQAESNQLELPLKQIVVIMLKTLNHQIDIQNIQDFDDAKFEAIKDKVINFKENLESFDEGQFYQFPARDELIEIKEKWLQVADLQLQNLANLENKTPLYLMICANQLVIFALLSNQMYSCQQYVHKLSDEIEVLQKRQSPNKNFLEGAYKLLLMQSSQIRRGEVCVPATEQSSEEEDNAEEEVAGQSYAQQFLRALTAIHPNEEFGSSPDITIKRGKRVTEIFIDVNVKVDIILSSIMIHKQKQTTNSVSTQTIGSIGL